MQNKVTGPYSAIVDGQPTGLMGCYSASMCNLECLRKDSRLKQRFDFEPVNCTNRIPLNLDTSEE